MERLLIAGTSSSCGKTTVTCALLAALKNSGKKVTAFKCGPDYLDPMLHRAVSGTRAYNLDPFFLTGKGLRQHLVDHTEGLAILEGAMGFYDGIAASDEASTYTVARATKTPVILVVSARGTGASLGALLEGFAHFRPGNGIAGVIFNDVNSGRYADLQRIADAAGLRSFGYLPRTERWTIPHRHLGLLAANEVEQLQEILQALGKQAIASLDLEGLLELSSTAVDLQEKRGFQPPGSARLRLAVAQDAAFCFLYEENLELLESLGCERVTFSPLRDRQIPPDIHGLYLCGGYPELHARALSGNISMRKSIGEAIKNGLPTLAESGGFLYLHQSLEGQPMCRVVDGTAFATKRLQRFGYLTLTARQDNVLCKRGESIRSREFHYWESDAPGDGFTAVKAGRDLQYPCVWATDKLFAGFPQLYFPANPSFAENFVASMKNFCSRRSKERLAGEDEKR